MLIGRRSLRLRNELEQEVRRQHWGGLPTEARERGLLTLRSTSGRLRNAEEQELLILNS